MLRQSLNVFYKVGEVMSKPLILAVDGGATKTAFSLRTVDQEIIFEATTNGSNYQAIGEQRVAAVFNDLLTKVKAHTASIQHAVFAIAGIDTPLDVETVQRLVQKSVENSGIHIEKITIENDVEATLLGITNGQAGALIISGTGALCYAFDGATIARTGGWGHRAGDEGSGYWIGQLIARAIFRTEDGRVADKTILTKLAFEKLGIQSIEQLSNWLYAADYTNARMASLSSLLLPALEAQDTIAQVIAKEAAYELALLGKATLQKINLANKPFPIYLNGGILAHYRFIKEELIERLQEEYPQLQFELCTKQPLEYIVKRALLL